MTHAFSTLPIGFVTLAHVEIAQFKGRFLMGAAMCLVGRRPGNLMEFPIAESLPKRSAVVTRRSEPANKRNLAGFRKVSVSDAETNARFHPDAKEPPCTPSDACASTPKKSYT